MFTICFNLQKQRLRWSSSLGFSCSDVIHTALNVQSFKGMD